MTDFPPMKAVVAFEIVARNASFGKAAEELNLTISAVSHQIATLEEYVGRKLFVRSPRGVVLTAAGERYRQSLAGALAIIADATQTARTETGTELLRIHSAPSFARLWLMPRLPSFRHAHPEIQIRLSASPGYSAFLRGEIDVEIRYGTVRWADLHAESVFAEEMMPLISPKLLARLALRSPEDLLLQDLILSDVNLVQWPQWFAANGIGICPSQYALRFDRAGLAIDAAVEELGIALESNQLAAEFLKAGTLVPVFAEAKNIRVHQHHLVYPLQHAKLSKVVKFASWLREEAAK